MSPHRRTLLTSAWTLLLLLPLTSCGSGESGSGRGSAAAVATPAAPTTTDTPAATDTPTVTSPDAAAVLRVAFLGDSYTVGVGSSIAGYVAAVADGMGWKAVNDGQSGTGYLNPGPGAGTSVFAGRVPAVAAEVPDVVVVQGSTNDVGQDPNAVGQAADHLYGALAAALPRSRIVVVGPLAAPSVDPAGVLSIRDALAAAAARAGLSFVDPIAAAWLQPPDGLYASDKLHPNDAGYAQIAARLVRALGKLGF
ncbi:SGNH/GDSL hydrolase family protein [Modestobacter sp. DSM 44400]|uniref:SGNH/GDSL hydrolase family protein n=1 Tax=Modestobacter sp. DSM 44400 TaxID=1550230 RepID=UPI001586FC9A|nr:SGNH/GDSL hydrolase family protein [Modestobacter sp. DSM 44400]